MKVKHISSQPDVNGFYRVTLVQHGNEVVILRRANDLPRLGLYNSSEVSK